MTSPPAFAPGQIWSLLPPADIRTRIRVGAIDRLGDKTGVHVEISNAPIPSGFTAGEGVEFISIGHVPFHAPALERAVHSLEAFDAPISQPFQEGLAEWRAADAEGKAAFFDAAPHEVVEMLFEAFRRAQRGE